MTIHVLAEKGVSKTEIGKKLGVTEGDVRYHLRHKGVPDGRRNKPFLAERFSQAIANWVASVADMARPVNVLDLFEHLVHEQGYPWSYKSVLRSTRG